MLQVNHLEAYYRSSYIIQRLSLQVGYGQGVALIGRNGAGKTTTLKSIMGLGPTVKGQVLFKGQDVTRLKPYQKARLGLGFVPEDRRIYVDLTVRDNLRIGQYAARNREAPSIDCILDAFPLLKELQHRKGGQLSGGEQQMLSVARAFMGRPDLILLDEPTEGLAPLIVKDLALLVSKFFREWNMALLLTEQNLWFARYCTQYVYLIDGGQIVFQGLWRELDQQPELLKKYMAI